MASTYSALKIELIGTGEQSGTWGTTTNTNLGDAALGEAITGSADVAFSSADVTVTLTDTNASQTARNLRLNLTGTSGGARSLILGSGCQIEKLYLINNGLADAVTVKNTTGTGIAVPAGKTMFVFNNGTNVVDATTYLSSLTLGSALPVASGGTGATTAPGANANIQTYTTTPTAAGTTTLTNTSTYYQYFTGVTTQTIVLPVTSTLSLGWSFHIANNSTGNLTLNSSGANLVTTILPNTTAHVTCIGTTLTTAADWDYGFTDFNTSVPVALGGTGNTSATAYAVQCGGTTSTGAHQSIASVGTAGQVLTSNGAGALPTFQAAGGSSFPAGTRMSFQQTSAPTGWTKDTTADINDSILRLVTGTVTSGGTTAFSTWNAQTASGATTLSTAQIPSHTHTIDGRTGDGNPGVQGTYGTSVLTTATTNATGGGGSHTHSLTQSLKYYDFIIASKD